MGYNSAIPQSTDARAQSQSQILSNFQSINKVWADNHYPLNTDQNLTLQGMHTVLTVRPQGTDPTTAAGQVAFYNKLVSTIPQLFFRPQSNATPIQLTYNTVSTSGAQQFSFVAGPFIIYGGFFTGGVTAGTVVTLTPGSSLLYAGLTTSGVAGALNVIKSAVAANLNSPANSFTIQFTAGITVQTVYYFAIGLP